MLRRLVETIEQERGSAVLVLACSNLENELLPDLFDALEALGRSSRLDVLLYCRGGEVVAARRLGLLLHDYADDLTFIVPHHCQSAGTLSALCAHRIIACPTAMFSPIDPLLAAGGEGGGGAISSQDVRLFGAMARDWFGLDEREANAQALAALTSAIFPTTLTSFYRSTLEVQDVCEELLSLRERTLPRPLWAGIVERLVFGYHSHSFSLNGPDLAALGLVVESRPGIEKLAWEAGGILRRSIGGGLRTSVEEPWFDALIGAGASMRRRRRHPQGLEPAWEEFKDRP